MATLDFALPPFPLLATFVGSTRSNVDSRGGVSGGRGADAPRPSDLSLPFRKSDSACLVRSTLRVEEGVLRMRTAHSSNVRGGDSTGTTGSGEVFKLVGVAVSDEEVNAWWDGGRSANAMRGVNHKPQEERDSYLQKPPLARLAPNGPPLGLRPRPQDLAAHVGRVLHIRKHGDQSHFFRFSNRSRI